MSVTALDRPRLIRRLVDLGYDLDSAKARADEAIHRDALRRRYLQAINRYGQWPTNPEHARLVNALREPYMELLNTVTVTEGPQS